MKDIYAPIEPMEDSQAPAIARLQAVCNKIHELKDSANTVTFQRIPLPARAPELEAALRQQTVGRIMLQEGETFGIDDPSGYYPPMEMSAGDVEPYVATATAWKWGFGDGSSACQFDTELWYRKNDEQATQRITLYAGNNYSLPSISRSLGSIEYAETGYEGHGHTAFEDATEEDAVGVLNIVEPLVSKLMDIVRERMQENTSGNS